MKAITFTPGIGDVRMIEIPEPSIISQHDVILEVLQVGICGTDREEVEGGRADAPEGEDHLILGHEMFGRVIETGAGVKKVSRGEYAMFTVRRPCNHCYPCHHERNDMCFTGKYRERGIKGLHGYNAQYVKDNEDFLINVPEQIKDIGVLIEPMSIVEKALDEAFLLQLSRLAGLNQSTWLEGRQALVAGLGPIGLLAAFILKLKGADVFGLDIVGESSLKPSILKEIGGKYINGTKVDALFIDDTYGKMDLILEATGIAKLEFQLLDALGINGVYVLTGIPSGERPVCIMGNELMRRMVLNNQLMLGSVNAGIKHYHQSVSDLIIIKRKYGSAISRIITERFNYLDYKKAFSHSTTDEIKTILEWRNF